MSRISYRKFGSILIAIGLLGTSFLGGTWYGYTNRPAVEKVLSVTGQTPPPQLNTIDFNQFWDVWSRIEDKYVDKADVKRQDLVYGSIEGLVHSLNDPYSEFMPPPENQQFQQDIKGSFDGIGAEIGVRKGILTVIAPLKDMPAEKAGIKAGDKIVKIDDKSTSDLALNDAVRLIRGPKGSTVTLNIMRDSFSKPKDFVITRDVIKVQVLTTEKKGDGIFVIKLNGFTENAGTEFRKAVEEFKQSGSKKLVLDLRNDPGGFLLVAVDIGSWFFPSGDIIARERFADGTENLYRSNGYQLLEKVPMVTLINEGSASASEILAGALRDNRGIQLIGNKSFGKGSVQEVMQLSGGSSLKLTIAKWLTPKGQQIHGKGLDPDIKVDFPDDTPPGKDPVMDKAVEVLKGM